MVNKASKDQRPASRVALLGLMSALALILGFVETLVPMPFVVPGVKLGLGNIAVITTLLTLGLGPAVLVMFIKVFASALLFGNVALLAFSLAGGVLSLFVMWGAAKTKLFSIVGISVLGGITHNIGQLIVVGIVFNMTVVLAHLPILLISGLVMGFLTGQIARVMLKLLQKSFPFKSEFLTKESESKKFKGGESDGASSA